jgi:hypothetical protein
MRKEWSYLRNLQIQGKFLDTGDRATALQEFLDLWASAKEAEEIIKRLTQQSQQEFLDAQKLLELKKAEFWEAADWFFYNPNIPHEDNLAPPPSEIRISQD